MVLLGLKCSQCLQGRTGNSSLLQFWRGPAEEKASLGISSMVLPICRACSACSFH